MAINRKLPAMHAAYGIKQGYKCRDCSNFRVDEYHKKRYFKCAAYGITFDFSTDWRANFTACGFFNNPMDGWTPLIEKIRRQKSDGQMKMEVDG